jgi:propionate CoA-transferase
MDKATIEISDEGLHIVSEGKITKFVSDVEQITFAGSQVSQNQKVLYITERCVFRLTDGHMVLTEIAPGIDLQKDILDKMDFRPEISEDGPKLMNIDIFKDSWGKLSSIVEPS